MAVPKNSFRDMKSHLGFRPNFHLYEITNYPKHFKNPRKNQAVEKTIDFCKNHPEGSSQARELPPFPAENLWPLAMFGCVVVPRAPVSLITEEQEP